MMRQQNKKHRTARKHKAGPNYAGQHLLHHPQTIRRLMDTIDVRRRDTVLDLGAGKGHLTFPLAERAGKVIAVELDADYVHALRLKADGHRHIQIIHGDIRQLRLPSRPFCVVANIPFAITTPILDKLLGAEGRTLERAALILEKGAARRFTRDIAPEPRLLMWRTQFRIDIKAIVPRTHFAPPPRVDAAIIRIVRRETPLVPAKEARRFAAFAAYMLREPKLMAARALGGVFTPAQVTAALRQAKADREQAIASLSLEQWASLYMAMLRHVPPYRWPK